MDWIYGQAPIALLAPVLFGILFGCLFIGFRLRHRSGSAATGDEPQASESMIASTVLGLLALLLGFTFSLAVDRYDTRRGLVVSEANAIGTTYLRAQLLDEPHRSRISAILVDYTALRLELAQATDAAAQDGLLRRSSELQHALWTQTLLAVRPARHLPISNMLLSTTNETIDLATARTAARRAHVPTRVLSVLLVYMAITALFLGYVMPLARARWATGLSLALFGMAYLLILDIDRPTRGGLRESQMAMQDLLDDLRANPPTSYPR